MHTFRSLPAWTCVHGRYQAAWMARPACMAPPACMDDADMHACEARLLGWLGLPAWRRLPARRAVQRPRCCQQGSAHKFLSDGYQGLQ
eukprot:353568-Chlamydomonas_euryale.AAC.8